MTSKSEDLHAALEHLEAAWRALSTADSLASKHIESAILSSVSDDCETAMHVLKNELASPEDRRQRKIDSIAGSIDFYQRLIAAEEDAAKADYYRSLMAQHRRQLEVAEQAEE